MVLMLFVEESIDPGFMSHCTGIDLIHPHTRYGLFPLPDSDSDSDSDSVSQPYGYIVLCRTCVHWVRFRFRSLSYSICIVEESLSESELDSESGNGNKPLLVSSVCSSHRHRRKTHRHFPPTRLCTCCTF